MNGSATAQGETFVGGEMCDVWWAEGGVSGGMMDDPGSGSYWINLSWMGIERWPWCCLPWLVICRVVGGGLCGRMTGMLKGSSIDILAIFV